MNKKYDCKQICVTHVIKRYYNNLNLLFTNANRLTVISDIKTMKLHTYSNKIYLIVILLLKHFKQTVR